jgi:transcriptional regulator with XRE-family HTH domain
LFSCMIGYGAELEGLTEQARHVRFVRPMDGIEPTEICARIKRLRESSPLTQPDFARAIGASLSSLNTYERKTVPWDKLGAIASLTGADLRWIVFGHDPLIEIDKRLSRIEAALATQLAGADAQADPGRAVQQFLDWTQQLADEARELSREAEDARRDSA